MVAGEGFEPSKLSRRIYSPLPLATRATCHVSRLRATPQEYRYLGYFRQSVERLKGVHNVSVTSVKGEVVPGPICHRSNFVTPAQNIK